MPTSSRFFSARNAFLLLFAVTALAGLGGSYGWWTDRTAWIQPLSDEPALPPSSALAFLLLGAAPLLMALRLRKASFALGLAGALLGLLALVEKATGANLGLDNLLVRHPELVVTQVGRIPPLLASVFLSTGLLLAWRALPVRRQPWQIAVVLAGSLTGAYGLVALLAENTGLAGLEFWRQAGLVDPYTAAAVLVLGVALVFLAVFDPSESERGAESRWVWLPVVTAAATATFLFWVTLTEREITQLNTTTQLTINHIATLFHSESERKIDDLIRLASRWNENPAPNQAAWEHEAREEFEGFAAYRHICWVDRTRHSRWLWPHNGNEEAVSFDHSSDPLRNHAMDVARSSAPFAVAAPLHSPVEPPSFAVYAAVRKEGEFDGFIVGEFGYGPLFELLDLRLNLSPRYRLEVSVPDPLPVGSGPPAALAIYASGEPDRHTDPRLRQSATFNLFGQRLTFTLAPRSGFDNAGHQFLPQLALYSGLGLSALLGLVVNLIQTARHRQKLAERASRELRTENDERRRIEEQLTIADDRLNRALDATQVGVFEWDVVTGQFLFNPGFWSALGLVPEKMPSTAPAWESLMHPDDAPAYAEATRIHFRAETPFIECEYRLRDAQGQWQWFSTRAKCVDWDRNNRPLRVAGTAQNITARRVADEKLRASQTATRVLTHVARRTQNVVFITTLAGRIEWVNDSFTRLTGRETTAVIGLPLLDVLANPGNLPDSLAHLDRALHRGEPLTSEVLVHVATEPGKNFHLRLELQPVRNERNELENFIAMGSDITTSIQTEAALRQAKADADEASRAKSEFLATMSHEIRTPMNGVIGMTSLLLETDLSAEQRDYVGTIRSAGNSLLSVINEILDFSKIESGRMEIEYQPFEVAHCVDEALDIFALQASAKNIEIASRIDPTVPAWLLLDMSRVRQILVNLLSNAVKFTARGWITVEVRPARPPGTGSAPPVSPPAAGDRQLIEFSVRDTGVGIPADRRHLLFKPFSQVDSSTTRRYDGAGLGLAISDRLCRLMGGSIDVEDNPGGGSVFRFRIAAEAVKAPGPATFPALPSAMHQAPVLILGDFPLNRLVLREALARLQLQGLEASSPGDGAEIALRQPLVAAIVDNSLPAGAGAAFAHDLRQRHPRLPVILLVNPLQSPRRSDANDTRLIYVPKPIKPAQILETLHNQLVNAPAQSRSGGAGATPADTAALLATSTPLDVLLVEDNPVNQKVATRLLERLGYRPDVAGNGYEALQALDVRKFDLVFMDMQMPEMDGLTATREIRRRYPAARQPRIIALTANAIPGDRERCLESGMDDYVSKPAKLEDLRAVIIKYFSSGKPA